jgi:hypothetical protein
MSLVQACEIKTSSLRDTWLKLTYLLTELSPSWGAINWAATQELPSISWNPKVQHRIHKNPPLVPILRHINPIHTNPSYLSKIYFDIVLPPTSYLLVFPVVSFLLAFPPISYMHSSSPPFVIHAPPINLIIRGEEYKLWGSSLCSFLHSPVNSVQVRCLFWMFVRSLYFTARSC